MDYTVAQQQAIGILGHNLQILACAGSGKTQTIAARAVEVLKQPGIAPRNIVAFTFTEKAAGELKERIAKLVGESLGPVHGLAEMYVGTIHGFCLDFLQTYLYEFLKYTVLNDIQTRLLVARNSKKSGLADVDVISGPKHGEKLSRNARDVRIFLEALNVLREDNVTQDLIPAVLRAAHDKYADLLDAHRYLDYSAILVEAAAALLDPSDPNRIRAQQQIAERVRYLIVDEYQDVNPVQEAIIRRLHELGANVCVVGDDDQTIYQWRGSEIRNIIEFQQRYPAVESVTLAENFRSSPGVVEAARQIAERNNPNRLAKVMVAAGHQGYEPGDVLALTFNYPAGEATWIAQKVPAMRGIPFQDEPTSEPRGLSWSDCAVLLRSVRNNAEPIVAAFRAAGIPFVIGGFGNLFDADEVRAAVALFEYVVGRASADELCQRWQAANVGVTDAELTAGIAVLDQARSFQPGERWSAYNLQRTFLNFLDAVQLREERIPPTALGPRADHDRARCLRGCCGDTASHVVQEREYRGVALAPVQLDALVAPRLSMMKVVPL